LRISVEAEHVRIERGGRGVLDDLSFVLHPGEALIVTGPNGSGKSTLLRALAGLLPIVAGRIAVRGLTDAPPVREIAHYVGHLDGNKASLSAQDNLAFWTSMLAGRQPWGRASKPAEALASFGLAHVAQLPLAVLSAGQKRRVALARLLVAKRPLWLLDEPTTALDAASQARLAERMGDHLGAGGMIVAATHGALPLPHAQQMVLGR
jgi:heme exporter protein A